MEIKGLSEQEIAALCDMWKLGRPIDVRGFLERKDISDEVKLRVRKAAGFDDPNMRNASSSVLGEKWRLAQAQIILEVSKLVLPSEE